MSKVHDTPSAVDAEDGLVFVDGPAGISVALTPEAAAETSDRLLYASAKAQGQQISDRVIKAGRSNRRLT